MTRTIAIAGLGAAARDIHLPAYAKVADLKVVGGFDPNPPAGKTFSFPLFDSFQKMIQAARPDIVAIVTPTAFHFDLTTQALREGCHVLCEKPFMSDMEQATAICRLADEVKRQVVVNNQYRFMKIHQAAKAQIASESFGRLLFMNAQQTFFTSEKTEAGWRGQDPQRTCKEFGIHVLDLARFFFDEDPSAIRARMPKPGGASGPDHLNLIELEFSGDRVAHITLDRLSRGPHRYLDLRLDGSGGCVQTHLGGEMEFACGVRGGTRRPYANLSLAGGGWARVYSGEKYEKIATDPLDLFADATARLVRAFLEALDNQTPPPCRADDNRRTLALMLAAYESAERRKTIEMDYGQAVVRGG
jgi:predicted dehydrogenase